MNNSRRIFEAFEQWVTACGSVFETQVSVVQRAFNAAGEADPEEIGQPEVLSFHAPFIVEAGFVSGDETAAALREFTELLTLRI